MTGALGLGAMQAFAAEQMAFQLGAMEIQSQMNMVNTVVTAGNDAHKNEQKTGQESSDNGGYR